MCAIAGAMIIQSRDAFANIVIAARSHAEHETRCD
jgi:hypothetical protein